ncbi:MAG: hypothetical protein ORN98_11280 [Alphaproteobacteria bacterium]|nr:hypothetical protein [Alphaproteobacteria bacterium]
MTELFSLWDHVSGIMSMIGSAVFVFVAVFGLPALVAYLKKHFPTRQEFIGLKSECDEIKARLDAGTKIFDQMERDIAEVGHSVKDLRDIMADLRNQTSTVARIEERVNSMEKSVNNVSDQLSILTNHFMKRGIDRE